MQKKFITVGGDSICYVDEGKGPVLLLVHGFLVSHAVWKPLIPKLSQHFRVIAVDLVGHGDSARPDVKTCRYDADYQAMRLGQLCDALGVEKAVVVGHSMGGKVSVHFAAMHPARVARLMLVDSQGMPQPLPFLGKLVLAPGVGKLIFIKGYKKPVVKAYFKGDVFSDPRFVTDEMVDEVYRCLELPNGREAMYAMLQRTVQPEPGFVEKVQSLKVPLHLLWGSLDKIYPLSIARKFQEVHPSATLKVFDGVAHSPPEEKPDQTVEEIIAFARGETAAAGAGAQG